MLKFKKTFRVHIIYAKASSSYWFILKRLINVRYRCEYYANFQWPKICLILLESQIFHSRSFSLFLFSLFPFICNFEGLNRRKCTKMWVTRKGKFLKRVIRFVTAKGDILILEYTCKKPLTQDILFQTTVLLLIFQRLKLWD